MNAGAARPVSTSTVVVTSAKDRFGRGHSEYLRMSHQRWEVWGRV